MEDACGLGMLLGCLLMRRGVSRFWIEVFVWALLRWGRGDIYCRLFICLELKERLLHLWREMELCL